MENLLKHLIDITCQRDHALLDSSVVSALNDLISAKQIRMHELFHFRDALFIRPRAWTRDGKVVTVEDSLDTDSTSQPITNYPGLVESIRERKNCLEEATAEGDRTLWLPLWLHDKVSSCLEVVTSTSYGPDTMSVIEGILNVYRNYQNLLDYSERDSLTGLLNRKTFDEKFTKLLMAAASSSAPTTEEERRSQADGKENWLGVVDIDHFKRINDKFGHLYGDEVLILVANLLRSSFRSHDRVFRFGGEEFVILLRSATLEDARKIFDRFRGKIEAHDFPQVGQVTISLGFTRITAESPVVILGRADQALYFAKENGRNRVSFYDELISSGALQSEASSDSVEFFFE